MIGYKIVVATDDTLKQFTCPIAKSFLMMQYDIKIELPIFGFNQMVRQAITKQGPFAIFKTLKMARLWRNPTGVPDIWYKSRIGRVWYEPSQEISLWLKGIPQSFALCACPAETAFAREFLVINLVK